jgi:NADPH-dependent F420 reductase
MLAGSDIVFLTVPYRDAISAIESCCDAFVPGQILVDVTVPLDLREGRAEYLEQAAGSNSELLAGRLPAWVRLVAAFKTIPAHVLAQLEQELNCDVFVSSDDKDAREQVMQAASLIPTLRPIDAGPLRTARTLERMSVLAVNLNLRHTKKGSRFRVEGL